MLKIKFKMQIHIVNMAGLLFLLFTPLWLAITISIEIHQVKTTKEEDNPSKKNQLDTFIVLNVLDHKIKIEIKLPNVRPHRRKYQNKYFSLNLKNNERFKLTNLNIFVT